MDISPSNGEQAYGAAASQTRRLETQRRHALERYSSTLDAVQDLERRLDVTERWEAGTEMWEAAAIMVGKRRYQRVLDQLQGLVISRMFELTKMNMSGTGMSLPYL